MSMLFRDLVRVDGGVINPRNTQAGHAEKHQQSGQHIEDRAADRRVAQSLGAVALFQRFRDRPDQIGADAEANQVVD